MTAPHAFGSPPARHGRVRPALALALLALLLAPILFLRLTSSRQRPHQDLSLQTAASPIAGVADPTAPEQPHDASPARSSVAETSESVPTPSASPTPAASLDLTVLWDDGTPVSASTVAITSDEEVLEHGLTGTDGRLQLDAVSEAGAEVFVVQGAVLVSRIPLAAPSGAARIEVPLLRSVRGIVRVEGDVPPKSILVRLETSEAAGTPRLPPPFVQEVLEWHAQSNSFPSTRTDAEGGFTLGGLAENWSGVLVPGWPYRLSSGDESLRLDAPTSNLVVDLAIPPSIRGRVLSPAGEPVPGCQVLARTKSWRGSRMATDSTGINGHFLIALPGDDVRSAAIDFTATGIGIARLETPLNGGRGIELGDVLLAPGRTLAFRVVDSHGAPIPAAIASYSGREGPPSGENGICTLDSMPFDALTVTIAALSCHKVDVDVEASGLALSEPETLEHPIEVVLHRDASLEVLFRDADGVPAPGLVLQLEGTDVFATESSAPGWGQDRFGASRLRESSVTRGDEGQRIISASFQSGSSNRVFATLLCPEVPIQATAYDTLGSEVGWTDTILLRPEESRRIEATIDGKLATLRGHVLAEDGSPVPNAAISFPRFVNRQVETDSEGAFEMTPVSADTLSLLVRASAFAPRILHGVQTDQAVEIQLERGRRMLVTVLDSTGTIHPPDRVSSSQNGVYLDQGTVQADGRAVFEHLPFGPVDLQVLLDDTWFSAPAEDGPETLVCLPEPGSLRVHVDPDLAPNSMLRIRLTDVAGKYADRWHVVEPEERATGEVILPVVYPATYDVRWAVTTKGILGESVRAARVRIRSGIRSEVSPLR